MSEGDATAIEDFVRSDLFRAILRTQHADLLSASTTAASTVPTGAVVPYAVSSAPDGWLLCDGQDVYKDLYPSLYALLTTTYGTPSDTLKFRLPDLQGRVPVGYGSGYGTLNSPAGSKNAILVSHDHGGVTGGRAPGTTDAQPRAFAWGAGAAAGTSFLVPVQPFGPGSAFNWYDWDPHSHTVNNHDHSISSAGESGTDKNMQPYIVLNYIIRT